MKEKKELSEHIKAIGKWAAENPKRVAFVVCGEITDDGVETFNALVGRTDRIARAIFGSAMKEGSFRQTTMLAAKMIENPLFAAIVGKEVFEDSPSESKSGLTDALKDLLGTIADKLRKND